MKIKKEEYLNKEMLLIEDIGSLKQNRRGICTAELKKYNVFAAWFKEPVASAEDGRCLYWVNFE